MRLSWNEIKARAAQFARDFADATRERSDAQTFFNEFFEVFGLKRRRVAYFEHAVTKYGGAAGAIDLFWPGKLLVEQKSAGKSLARAREQALDYFPGIAEKDLPRYVLLCDFQTFELVDLDTREETRFTLAELPQNIEKFSFILGVEKRTFKEQDPVNIEAAELMGELHDALEASNYWGHDLERLLVRLLFCLFADDTGIFEPRGIMEDLIVSRTSEDGADTGQWLHSLFQVLDTPEDRRQTNLDIDLAQFPYVNGDLFAERLPIAQFDRQMRDLLIKACGFKWEAISPAIFGSLFQFVMAPDERRREGAHYTNERCILKVIEPLFLDELRAEFEHIQGLRRDRETRLRAFHDKLAGLTFFDPACGCGNFLVIAYRELRAIETELLKSLYEDVFNRPGFTRVDHKFDVGSLTKLSVEQFYGIELGEFPARIAEVALWMMDHIANVRLSLEFGENYARIPLRQSPHIVHADALEYDWESVLSGERCSYIFGNPPFVGAKMQSAEQRLQVRRIASLPGAGGTLDYVAAWFIKAGEYSRGGCPRIGLVATNSITQGEQVAQLWPILFDRCGLELAFAHRTFAWESEARGRAHVHVVILGLTRTGAEPEEKRLFSYADINGDPVESRHGALSPYLIDATKLANRHLVVESRGEPICDAPKLVIGSKPIDGGYFILSRAERDAIVANDKKTEPFIRPYVGAEEHINGGERFIIAVQEAEPNEIEGMPEIAERVRYVREFRLGRRPPRNRPNTRPRPVADAHLADTPTLYHVNVVPDREFLVVPKVSSENREYAPIGFSGPPVVPSDLVFVAQDADLFHFAVLTSRMHMAWLSNIGGRLESRYRYSIGVVYNNFPWPSVDEGQRNNVIARAQNVIDARTAHPHATLGTLYDSTLMPADLRRAHRDLDAQIDKLYRREPFASDRARVEHLFARYEAITAPLVAASRSRRRRR